MPAAAALSAAERDFLDGLNRESNAERLDPDFAVDWGNSNTQEELLALYGAWSLLVGSGKDSSLPECARIDYVRYQQANLMLFTALLELHGLRVLEGFARDEPEVPLAEALAHFAREETVHHRMFIRAIGVLESEMPRRRRLPRRHVELFFRALFALLALLPARRFRIAASFMVLEFAEEVSILAHKTSARAVDRKESLIPRVWAVHAQDEARHLRFDAFVRRRYRLPVAASLVARTAATGLALLSSALLNANDVWAARQVGARVSLWHLPVLLARTNAPFKRSVFATVRKVWKRAA